MPPERIAQLPSERRDEARLMLLDRESGGVAHSAIAQLAEALRGDEIIVVNDTRVVPARLRVRRESGGNVELLALPPSPSQAPERRTCLWRASRPLRAGAVLLVPGSGTLLRVISAGEGGRADVDFSAGGTADAVLERFGEVPLPPYIRRTEGGGPTPEDRLRYQTIFARSAGAVAAPTAGLHFTPELMAVLEARGVPVVRVTLHVGPGTFQPVRTSDLREHRVEGEWSEVSGDTAAALESARSEGRRVLAVGTTTVRTLEGAADDEGRVQAGRRLTDLTIVPGHRFKVVGSLLTNFHLPRSSLLVLVAAFAGRAKVLAAYEEAVQQGYRFYSYGDAMLIADGLAQ